ncbi:hypothetical protein CBW65_13115 [Tumebacillus avium]|uniref:HTH cro/C1-type domain-containing protein n=1 Tax=Tumebacillus avium TaxID=1903704 RepID=A0A1Y0IQZ4_9BACL|nr:helix-turn-helix domain-containing protein [Tumebacillus avium]ARU61865.1 hypothetical protein CBW65_13115 [Tumebacillus avium]
MNSLGQRIRDLRQKKGLTQIDLGKDICTPSMISQIESDRARPSYKVLYAIADRLEVPLEHLLKDVGLGLEHSSKYKMAVGLVRSKEFRSAIPLLKELLTSDNHHISKIKLQLEIAYCYLELGNASEAIPHLTQVYEWAFIRNDKELLILSQLHLGSAYRKNNDYAIAIYHTTNAYEEIEKTENIDSSLRAKVLVQLASLYENTGRLSQATDFYEKALHLLELNTLDRGKMLLKLADAHYRRGNFESADECATKACLLLEEQNDADLYQEWAQKLIMLTRSKHDVERSIKELLLLTEKYEEKGDTTRTGQVLADLALIYVENGEFDQAWIHAKKAKLKLPPQHSTMGHVFHILALICFEQQDTNKGTAYLDNAIAIFKRNGKLDQLEEVTMCLCHFLRDQGRHQESFERLEQFHQYLMEQLEQRGIFLRSPQK